MVVLTGCLLSAPKPLLLQSNSGDIPPISTMSRLLRNTIPLLLVLALCCVSEAWGCPTCKEGMEHDPEAAAMARGYFWSILFMMSMPFLIVATLGSYFYWEIRKARRLASLPSLEAAETAIH